MINKLIIGLLLISLFSCCKEEVDPQITVDELIIGEWVTPTSGWYYRITDEYVYLEDLTTGNNLLPNAINKEPYQIVNDTLVLEQILYSDYPFEKVLYQSTIHIVWSPDNTDRMTWNHIIFVQGYETTTEIELYRK